jgi:MFS family permease
MMTSSRASDLRLALSGMLALAVAMGIGRFAFTPILPMMQEDAGLDAVAGGWLASANYAGYLVGAVCAAALARHAGRMLAGGLAMIVIATAAMGLTGDFAAWAALRFAAGIASAFVFVAVSTLCLEGLSMQRRTLLGGVLFSGVGVGIAAAGLLCLALMQIGAGSASAWMAAGIASLAVSLLILPVFGRGGPVQRDRLHTAWRVRGREAWRAVACYGTLGFGYIVPATFLPVMARQALPDAALFGWSWPVFGFAAAVSTLIAASRPASLGNRGVWIASHLVLAGGIVLPVFVPGLGAVMLAGLLVGGTFMVATMSAMQQAKLVAGADAAPLIAVMTVAFALGQILGPIATGALLEAGFGLDGGLLLAGGLMLLSAAALWQRPAATLSPSLHGKDIR